MNTFNIKFYHVEGCIVPIQTRVAYLNKICFWTRKGHNLEAIFECLQTVH